MPSDNDKNFINSMLTRMKEGNKQMKRQMQRVEDKSR